VTGLPPGKWWFSLAAVTTDGVISEFATAEKDITTFTSAELDVYGMVVRQDRVLLSRVGTVPFGTACNPAETLNGKYAVPRALVTFAGGVKPQVVYATCR
jgi:hypothetical protein